MGKTHYALEAAKAGFNVTVLDGDVAGNVLAQKDFDDCRERISYFAMQDTMTHSIFGPTIEKMFNTPTLLWNDTEGRELYARDDMDEAQVTTISLGAMDHRDLIIMDSWTALSESFCARYCAKAGVKQIAELTPAGRRTMYQCVGAELSQISNMIRSCRCHVICIAHPDEYERKTKPKGKVSEIKEEDMIIVSTKLTPKSISKPHGATLAAKFTDVVWLEIGFGGKRYIDGRPSETKDGGGRFDAKKLSSEFSFVELVRRAGGYIPPELKPFDSRGTKYYAKGEYKPAGPAKKKTLAGLQNTSVKGLGTFGKP